MSIGGPQAHGNSKPLNERNGLFSTTIPQHFQHKRPERSSLVYLWGIVVEHELGWRAQFACPKNFFLPLEMLPVSMSILEPRLKTLATFGCGIHLIGREGNMPLWVRNSGYEAAALDLLVQRCKSWYARR